MIKRVVAIAGDKVEVRDDIVYLNGAPVMQQAECGDCKYEDSSESAVIRPCRAMRETMGRASFTTIYNPEGTPSSWGPMRVPEGKFFVMGDHRDNSSDSRYWGFVPNESVLGKAMVVWWSVAGMTPRWERMFHAVK